MKERVMAYHIVEYAKKSPDCGRTGEVIAKMCGWNDGMVAYCRITSKSNKSNIQVVEHDNQAEVAACFHNGERLW